MENKFKKLKSILISMESVLVAFSGGVDSTFLLKVASDSLKDHVLAVTSDSPTITRKELAFSKEIAEKINVKHLIIKTDELNQENFTKNNTDRCFWCKTELFSKLTELAKNNNLNYVADGSNFDDIKDYRPGREAAKKLGVRSPLLEAGLTKKDIREISRSLDLQTWNKPSNACLSSRVPYGSQISTKVLKRIEDAEEILRSEGFDQVRLRDYEELAKIEVMEKDIPRLLEPETRKRIIRSLKDLSYCHITLDLQGYRTGSLNESRNKVKEGTA